MVDNKVAPARRPPGGGADPAPPPHTRRVCGGLRPRIPHLRHHADIRCNEGISGVFGIPIYDFIFGTYVDPSTLYIHGRLRHHADALSCLS